MSVGLEIKGYGLTLKVTDEGSFLTVADKMWADSFRQIGFPVYALTENVESIGVTKKNEETYQLPKGAFAIVRVYITTKVSYVLYIYTVPELSEHAFCVYKGGCRTSFKRLPEVVREPFKSFLEGFFQSKY